MLVQTIVLGSIATLGALARPQIHPSMPAQSFNCLSDKDALDVGNLWRALIGPYNQTTFDEGVVANYSDYSASALSLNSICLQAPGPPLNATDPLFTTRAIFEMAQGSQAPIPSTVLDVWHSCSTVFMRYEMCVFGNCTIPVIGNIAIETVKVCDHVHVSHHQSTYTKITGSCREQVSLHDQLDQVGV